MTTEKTAIYCRLSQDDGQTGESGSIQTQKTLLTQYCNDHHIAIGGYYCDDGWSGTNFDRPDFQRMIGDIEAGIINTVIVKDLSRFGREYAQMGLYIEHYFEQKGIRFISVTENIDTKSGVDNLMLPFTNVINSYYVRQASTKTKAGCTSHAIGWKTMNQLVLEDIRRNAKAAKLATQKYKLTKIICHAESVYENIDNFLPIIQKYTDITELNTHILNELIQKILVYEKTDNLMRLKDNLK